MKIIIPEKELRSWSLRDLTYSKYSMNSINSQLQAYITEQKTRNKFYVLKIKSSMAGLQFLLTGNLT